MNTNILKNKLLFFLILVIITGCQNATIKDDGISNQPIVSEITKSSFHDGTMLITREAKAGKKSCWNNIGEGNVFILAAGANTGTAEENLLRRANYDAKKFADAMRQLFKVYERRVCVLENAYKSEFVQALTRLKHFVTPNDLVVIYFSGHGDQTTDRDRDEIHDKCDEFFVTYPEKSKHKFKNSLTDDEFDKLIGGISTNHILTVVDACHSGGSVRGEGSSEIVKSLSRGNKPTCDFKRSKKKEPIKGMLLAAVKEYQLAMELNGVCKKTGKKDGYVGGRFTHFLVKASEQAMQSRPSIDFLAVFEEARKNVRNHSRQCSEDTQEPLIKGDKTLFREINRYIP